MTRKQCGSLLHCMIVSFTTPCRLLPAHLNGLNAILLFSCPKTCPQNKKAMKINSFHRCPHGSYPRSRQFESVHRHQLFPHGSLKFSSSPRPTEDSTGLCLEFFRPLLATITLFYKRLHPR